MQTTLKRQRIHL